MGFRGPKVIERGVFLSPALGVDSTYEVIEDTSRPNGLAVRCAESGETYGTDILAQPTGAQLDEQYNGFVRELAAWLMANNGHPAREERAVAAVRRTTRLDYSVEDLHDDIAWVRSHDLSARMNFLGRSLPEARRTTIISIAGEIAAANGLNETDARFVELLGAGLGFDPEQVMGIVMSAMDGRAAA